MVRTQRALIGSLALLASLAAGCDQSSEPSGNVGRGSAPAEAVELVIEDGRFQEDILELTAGEEVTVEVRNEDRMPHDFAIEALDINTGTIEAGQVATATFTVPEGTTEFVCTFHGGMTGVIKA